MRICFLGNVNNMPLYYARAMRTQGVEVTFYVDAPRNALLHRPESKYPELWPYPDWIRERVVRFEAPNFAYPEIMLRGLIREVNAENFDGIILDALFVGLGRFLRAPKFALLAGSDLDVFCDPSTADRGGLRARYGFFEGALRAHLLRRVVAGQRAGLRACLGYSYFPPGVNPHGDGLLAAIFEGKDPRRVPLRGVDADLVPHRAGSERTGDDVLLLSPVRFLYREPLPAGFAAGENKGNDRILEGVAKLRARTGRRPRLVLFEKGPDVEHARRLIGELGIGDQVTWCREVSHARLLEYYAEADVVFDQVGRHFVGAIGLEAMLVGRPVVANARPELYANLLPEPWPLCHATTADEVAAWLERLIDDPALRAEIGRRSRTFVQRHFSHASTARSILDCFATPDSRLRTHDVNEHR